MSEVKNEVVEQAAVQAEESKMKQSKVNDFESAKVSEIDFSGLISSPRRSNSHCFVASNSLTASDRFLQKILKSSA